MFILKIICLSLGSLLVLFVLTKIMGNREMTQLTMFDYIVSITIGSIAAEMATSLETNFWEPVVAMITYGLATVIISIFTSHSLKFRKIILGQNLILFDDGKLFRNNFKKAKLDLGEFLMQCRSNGYFNLADLQTIILEPNGKLSFLPKSEKRPSIPEDLNLKPKQENLLINIIADGILLEQNLYKTGNSEIWLQNELSKQNIKNISDVFLATCDNENNLSIYKKY